MKFFRCILGIILVFCTGFTMLYGGDKISYSQGIVRPIEFKGVVTLWHIDTFEGGQGSRKQFLLNIATQFEKENEGVLIMVLSQTPKSVKDNMANGQRPDMISYGAGVNIEDIKELSLKQTFYGGMVGEKSFALPWCRGSYVLMTNPSLVKDIPPSSLSEVVISTSSLNQSLTALALSGYTAERPIELPPLEAYVKFLDGKTPYFVGTQRDVVRVANRGVNVNSFSLNGYNDLYQYISVCSNDSLKRQYSEKFIEFLIGEKCQKQLSKIAMFSPYYSVEYDNSVQTALQKEQYLSTVSAFSSEQLFLDLQLNAQKALFGDKSALDKIKKVTIKP